MLTHDALYYPFSRCLDVTLLKQLLLLFDSVTFVDPVDDDYWRSKLILNLEREHVGFGAYRSLADCMPWLRETRIVRVIDPSALKSVNDDLTAAATLSDLRSADWIKACDPRRFKLPTQYDIQSGKPCWNIFRPKIPNAVLDALANESLLTGHLIKQGGDHYNWMLSYAAGSAVGVNVHLAAADELNLAPITDSRLHHELVLMKLSRSATDVPAGVHAEAFADQVARRAIVSLVNETLPAKRLEQLSLEEILRFRDETAYARKLFVSEVRQQILSAVKSDEPAAAFRAEQDVVANLLKNAKAYGDEIAGTRDRLWPKMIGSFTAKIPASTTLAGLAASYISGSSYVLAASVLLYALEPLKCALEWRADLKKANRSASSAVAYLSQVGSM